jgi:PAS domain S-box-containing protein
MNAKKPVRLPKPGVAPQAAAQAAKRRRKVKAVVGQSTAQASADTRRSLDELQAYQIELEQQKDELRESEARFRALVETTCDWIWEVDAQGYYTYASPKVRDLLGYAPEEVVGRTPFDFMPEKEAQRVAEAFAGIAAQRLPLVSLENTNRHKDGHLVVLETSGVPILGPSGEFRGYRGIDRDISARQRQETALRESEVKLRLLTDNVPAVVAYVSARELRYLFVNKAYAHLFGRMPEQMAGEHVRQAVGEEAFARALPYIERARAGEHVAYDNLVPVGGQPHWFSIRYVPEADDQGVVRNIIVLALDITERKHTEDALRDSEALYRFLVSNQRDLVTRHQPDGRILYVSPSAQELLGYLPEELLGQDGFSYAHPKDQARVREIIQRAAARHQPGFQTVHRLRTKAGPYVWVELKGRLIFQAPSQELREIHCVTRDVRERKRAERALQRSREQMRALAARIEAAREEERTQIAREVHDDLGQTLTGLKLDLAWMAHRFEPHQEPLSEKVAEMAQLIDTTIQTVRRISSDLRPGILDDLGLAAAIEWQAQEFERRTGMPCHYRCEGDIGEWESRRATALFRILQEALTNVVRHAQAKTVDIFLARRQDLVVLEVHDNGCGITKEALGRPGSLGLLSMRERASAFGGEVTIDSEPGGGTVVTARMPAESVAKTRLLERPATLRRRG